MSTARASGAPSAATFPAAFRYAAVTFDCADPAALARFYGDALGLSVVFSTDDFVLLGQGDGDGRVGAAGLGFNRLPGYRRPSWPGPAQEERAGGQEKQAHIEVGVDDVEEAQARLLALGAALPEFQPDPERWRVLLDPAGHPFCITTQV